MKIGIIGGGSIGLLFAHYLNNNNDVSVYVRTQEQAEMLASEGLVLQKDGVSSCNPINAYTIDQWSGREELTIIAVKQYHLSSLKHLLKKNIKTSFLFLQNGMGHLKLLDDINEITILLGVVEHGALKVNGNKVIHTGAGITKIADFKGKQQSLIQRIIASSTEDFRFDYVSDYYSMLSQKLLVNAVINPITAVLKVTNGELIHNNFYFQVVKQMVKELTLVLQLENDGSALAYVESICEKTSENRSSMLKDIEEGRPTEVDAILGYVLTVAKENRLEIPITEGFYQLIKGLELKGAI